MEKLNNNIINKIDDVILSIKDTDEYVRYLKILKQVENSNIINEYIEKIKQIQKELVKTPSIKLTDELNKYKKELNEIPLYMDYIDSINDVNEILLNVKSKIETFITDITV